MAVFRRRSRARLVLALAVFLLVSGCAGAANTAADNARGSVDPSATVQVGISVPPTQFDPVQVRSELASLPYFAAVYDTLIGIDAKGEPRPLLAESWQLAPDGMSITLKLRQGAVFHDGSPIDQAAVLENLRRVMASDNALAKLKFGKVASVEPEGEDSVVIRLREPEPLLVVNLASPVMSIVAPSSFAAAATAPVGSGPYRLVSQNQDSATYERFDGYWDPEGKAPAARLVIKGIADNAARINALRAGQLDFANAQPDQANDLKSLESDPNFRVLWEHTQATVTVYLNVSRGPLADPRVRRALNYAVDREALNEALIGGICPPTAQPFPIGQGSVPELDDVYTYDPEKTKALLAEAGAANLTLRGLFSNNALARSIAPAIQGQFQAAGVGFEMSPIPATEARATFRQGEADFLVLQINSEIDPALIVQNNFVGGDSPGGVTPEIKSAAEKVLTMSREDPGRQAALEEFSRAAVDTPTHVIICAVPSGFAYRSNVVGVEQMPWLSVAQNTDFRTLGKTSR
mgnify:CR=1 FL=1